MSQIYPPTPPLSPPPLEERSAPRIGDGSPPAGPPRVPVWRRLAPVAVALVAMTGGILAGVVVFRPHSSHKAAAAPTETAVPDMRHQGRAGRRFGGYGFADRPQTRGTITSITGQTLILSTFSGATVNIRLTDTTTVVEMIADPVGGLRERQLNAADLAAGDNVTVFGTEQGDTLTATSVRLGDFGPPFGPDGPPRRR